MRKAIEAAMDIRLEGMDKTNEGENLFYTGAAEVGGAVAGVAMMFFEGGLTRAMVQLTEVPENLTSAALALCAKINRHAFYRATLEEQVFVLVQDMVIHESFDPDRVVGALYMLLDGAGQYHVNELRSFMGELPNAAPPVGDGELPVS